MINLNPLRPAWSNDLSFQTQSPDVVPATFGPDGPWQATVFALGRFVLEPSNSSSNASQGPQFAALYVPLYPAGDGATWVATPAGGGNYSFADSSTAEKSGSFGSIEDWDAAPFLNSSYNATQVTDFLALTGTLTDSSAGIGGNVTVEAVSNWSIPVPHNGSDARLYQESIGTLGLGPYQGVYEGAYDPDTTWLLNQLKQDGKIASNSFGLHIGSVPLNISGSLILGGYDQARAVGPVGSFWYRGHLPFAILLDINLGAAVGDSPFLPNQSQHLLRLNGDTSDADIIAESFGAPAGAVIITPNPAYPYMALPPGTCEAIAGALPVTFNASIGFYTWNQHDPAYATIVNSPAYLEFVLADTTGTNLSIKVPFALLNLTLELPIVDTPTPYFPCQSIQSEFGSWMLGRAFLQAAFMAVSYETNITWLAQAPGPTLGQSVVYDIESADTTIGSGPLDAFAASWSRHWQVLSKNATNSTVAHSDSASGAPAASGLSAGAIAGIVIGCILGVLALAAILWFLGRARKRPVAGPVPERASAEMADREQGGTGFGHGPPHEADSALHWPEFDGTQCYEAAAPLQRYELDGTGGR